MDHETLQRLLGINSSRQIGAESPDEVPEYLIITNPLSVELAKKAYESILSPDENQNTSPGGDVENTVITTENVPCGRPSASFGQSQRESRRQEERRQRGVLRQAEESTSPLPGEFVANEGEHLVRQDELVGLAHKSTNNLRYGLILDQDEWKAHRKFTTRSALPSEYLWRIGLQNAVFEDAIRATGIGRDSSGEPTLYTSQPWIKGTAPDMDEIRAFMKAQGFEQIPSGMMAVGYPFALAWYRPKDQVLVYDTKPSNFVKTDNGDILPIDLVVQIYPVELLRDTAHRNEVKWPAIGA